MKFITCRWQTGWACTLALTALCASTVQAQSTPDAATTVAHPYRSVFEGYQKFNDQAVAPWTQTNATVETIGGWRVYAREARQANAPERTENAPGLSPKSGVHDAHGGRP
jgi:hypothetical protein